MQLKCYSVEHNSSTRAVFTLCATMCITDDIEHRHSGHRLSAFQISCAHDGHAMLWPQSVNIVVAGLVLQTAHVAEMRYSTPASSWYRQAVNAVVSDVRT